MARLRCRAGRNRKDLAREFEPSAQTIRNRVTRVVAETGRAPMSVKNCAVCVGRIGGYVRNGRSSQKPRAPGSLGRPIRGNLRVHESESGRLPDRADVPATRCLPEWLLRVLET